MHTVKTFALLMTLALSATFSRWSTASESEIDLNLPFPDFEPLEIGGVEHVKTDLEGFKSVARLYTTYHTLADVHEGLLAQIGNLEIQTESLETSLEHCETTLRAADDDRQWVYQLRKRDQHRASQEARKIKLRALLIGGGATLAGVGVGIILGALVIGR